MLRNGIRAGLALLVAASASAGVIENVLAALSQGSESRAIAELRTYGASHGATPELLEAMSWLARAELESRNYAAAQGYSQQTYDLCVAQLKKRPLDQESHLPIALGAAIEVQAGVMAAQGRRSEAVTYLQQQEQSYAATSIRTRIHKNILLLTLEGKPAPPLDRLNLPKGKPALLFFWAHWCPDCKAEIPVLARIKSEFVPQGLAFLAPTQKYGYVAGGADAAPAVETAYIEQVRQRYYAGLIDAPAAVSEANFTRYGASTTPTLVLVDRSGIVRLYHPGAMNYAELRQAVARVVLPEKNAGSK
jgi:thiol-disulfide isomerase/thioredoxin